MSLAAALEVRKREPDIGVLAIGVTGMATVASFSVIEPGTLVPQVRQKRLFTGSSVAQEEQRMVFKVPRSWRTLQRAVDGFSRRSR